MCVPSRDGRKETVIMKKYCTKCGKPFDAIGREVICPDCKAAAAEDAKRAAVLKAKRASWNGESVPVRISGRASTVIREYGAVHGLPFAAALDELLKASAFVTSTGKAWEAIEPYKSHRRDKHATAETPQEVKQDVPQDVTKAATSSKSTSSKATSSKAAGKAASKASASKE